MLSTLYGTIGAMQATIYEWTLAHANQAYLDSVYHGTIIGVIHLGQYFS